MTIETTSDLFHHVEAGNQPVVTFLPGIEDYESCIDRGMMGRIVGVTVKHGEFYCMRIALGEFEAYNDERAQRNYYDGDGNPNWTAKEAGQYPSDGVETIYMDFDLPLDRFMKIEGSVKQVVAVKVESATVYVNEGQQDVVIVELPQPMPIAGLDGNVKLTLLADEGTGVDYMREHFGIDCDMAEGGPDYDEILASYGAA